MLKIMNVRSRPVPLLPLFTLLLTPLLGGCGGSLGQYRPSATGPEGQITVVMDSMLWKGPVGDVLREELGPWLGTLPAPEPLFDLRNQPLVTQRTFDHVKTLKNLVFVAPLRDSTNESRFLNTVFDEQARAAIMSGLPAVVPRKNQWRNQQQVVYVAGATQSDLIRAIADAGEDLRYQFNVITRERVTLDMFDKGRQQDMEVRIMDKHDFAVNVQHDYFTAIDTTNFIWLRRVLTDTWRSVFVYYIENADPSDLDSEWIYRRRDALTKKYIQGNVAGYVKIDYRRPLETENINFLGRYGFETRGLWYMVMDGEDGELLQAGGGGPFVTYSFYDQDSGRIYIIDGMVFAPGYDKREFLRHMEAIAYTFRTKNDEAAEGTLAMAEPVEGQPN